MAYSWIELHGAVTHFPIALIITAFAFEIYARMTNVAVWRSMSYWCLLIGVLGGLAAIVSGLLAAQNMYGQARAMPQILVIHRAVGIAAISLAAIVLIWQTATADRLTGRRQYGAFVLLFGATALVGYAGYLGGTMVFGSNQSSQSSVDLGRNSAVLPANLDLTLVPIGKVLFQQEGCIACHQVEGLGGTTGPDLTNEGTRRPDLLWQIKHLENPSHMSPGSPMPGFGSLSQRQLTAIATYVIAKK